MTGRHGPPADAATYCHAHGKQAYMTRKAAKAAARHLHPGEHLREYRCDWIPGAWHIGHLPAAVVRRGAIYRRRGGAS